MFWILISDLFLGVWRFQIQPWNYPIPDEEAEPKESEELMNKRDKNGKIVGGNDVVVT